MALKQILILLDASRNCAGRLDLALELAREHGARVSGLHVVVHRFYQPGADQADEAAALKALFEARLAAKGVEGEWCDLDAGIVGASVAQVVSDQAQFADLVVVGQVDLEGKGGEETRLPEQVVLGSGRPVLIVPYAGEFTRVGDRVMLAWKSGRESARTVSDALPILARASRVIVAEVNGQSEEPPVERVIGYLARHGIEAKSERIPASQVGVADAMLNRVPVEGIDLLVMGAFGHNRAGAPVLGEVAKEMLKHMTVPVLMSH